MVSGTGRNVVNDTGEARGAPGMAGGMMGAILITGGAGYIGSHAAYAFLDAGREVAVLDDLSTGVRANLPAHVPFYRGCVSDRGLVTDIVARHGVEGALHFAGSVVVPESVA